MRASRLLLPLLAAAVLAGCSTTTAGTARPTPTESAGATSDESQPETTDPDSGDLPADGVPEVENPLDTAKFEDEPCRALTAAQIEGLNLGSTGTTANTALGKACRWRNNETQGNLQIAFFTEDPRGLSAEYRAEKAGEWAYFEELPAIEGHPAVARSGTDDRDTGGCAVVVGASDEIAFEVALQLSRAKVGQKDPCATAVDVAALALQTMKGGGR